MPKAPAHGCRPFFPYTHGSSVERQPRAGRTRAGLHRGTCPLEWWAGASDLSAGMAVSRYEHADMRFGAAVNSIEVPAYQQRDANPGRGAP